MRGSQHDIEKAVIMPCHTQKYATRAEIEGIKKMLRQNYDIADIVYRLATEKHHLPKNHNYVIQLGTGEFLDMGEVCK